MDRWEQHFAEKSRRRFEAEQLERRKQRKRMGVTIAFAVLLFLGMIVSLVIIP